MTRVIPLAALPSQRLSVALGQQQCTVEVYQKAYGLFVNLYVKDALIVGGVLARNMTKLVRSAYLGFVGDLAFYDTQGNDDPEFLQLGTRFVLLYWPEL